jgi:O-antigen/teichoic acid export membrane protein
MALFLPLPSLLFSVLSERRRQGQNDKETIAGLAFVGSVLVAILSLWLVLSLDWLVYYVFGTQWIDAVPVASLMMLSNILLISTLVLSAHLTANGHSSTWLYINIASTVLLWGVTAIAARQFGATGYAVGWLAACLLQVILLCIMARRLTGLYSRWSDSLYLVTAVGCTIGIVNWLPFDSTTEQLILKMIVGSLVFVVAILPLGYVRKPEWHAVFGSLPLQRQSW